MMRPNRLMNAAKILMAICAVMLSFSEFAEARDRHRGDHQIRRHHREQHSYQLHHRKSREVSSGVRIGEYRWRRPHRDHRSDRVGNRHHFQTQHHRRDWRERRGTIRDYRAVRFQGSSYGSDDFPSGAGGGTYFGGLSAWQDRGNGIYFQSERNAYDYEGDEMTDVYRRHRVKIIRVNPRTAGRNCSWEAGVCVIRP
ncbi:hypothetical protein [Pararhizobium gei]|uniref:hypothetical protein n=1 Tax=Pararhizobium gei TaxID=1395951 RepID=UPI0023DA4A95|nr:hypothetical protein [Rhizobium gei]